jgi:hypothetical protein
MFDKQIDQIFEFIDHELKFLKWDQPDVKIVSILASLL